MADFFRYSRMTAAFQYRLKHSRQGIKSAAAQAGTTSRPTHHFRNESQPRIDFINQSALPLFWPV
jgi:hypothetical protein